LQAIESAGSVDRDVVRKVLAEAFFETFFGPVKFNKVGQTAKFSSFRRIYRRDIPTLRRIQHNWLRS